VGSLENAGHVVKTCPAGSLIDLNDGVFCCEFKTKINALNIELVDFIHEALDYVDTNGVGLVIGNQPTGPAMVFSAAANLVEVMTAAKERRVNDISRLISRLQEVVQRMRYATFPVVAAPYLRTGHRRLLRGVSRCGSHGGTCRAVHGAGRNRRRKPMRRP